MNQRTYFAIGVIGSLLVVGIIAAAAAIGQTGTPTDSETIEHAEMDVVVEDYPDVLTDDEDKCIATVDVTMNDADLVVTEYRENESEGGWHRGDTIRENGEDQLLSLNSYEGDEYRVYSIADGEVHSLAYENVGTCEKERIDGGDEE